MLNAIGYDFGDTFVKYKNVEIAVRISTESNIYAPCAKHTIIKHEDGGLLKLESQKLSGAGGQIICDGRISLHIRDKSDGRICITAAAEHPEERCKSIQILVRGIHVQSIQTDSENMGLFDFTEKKGVNTVMYPGRSAMMPLIFIQTGEGEWFALSKDDRVRKKAFSAYHDYTSGQRVLVLSHEEDRRHWGNRIDLPEWQIGLNFPRQEIVMERCSDLEKYHGLVPFAAKERLKWMDDIKLVANFHGEHWTGYVFNTFDQMIEELRWLCSRIDGKHILAFLAAWDGRYYVNYPEHQVSIRMGGKEGLKRFVIEAHKLGVKVVLMLGGANLASFEFLERQGLADAALKNEWGYPLLQDWVDWNNDLSKECRGLVVNFGHPGFRKYMVESACGLMEEYDADGVFLDGAIRWENSPDYSPYEGLREWVNEMEYRYPEKLLMAEDGYDVLWGMFGLFATSWQPLGLENSLLRYTRQTYYLAYAAENGSGGVHEQAWHTDGSAKALEEYTIPTVSLLDGIIKEYGERIAANIERHKNWKLDIPQIASVCEE